MKRWLLRIFFFLLWSALIVAGLLAYEAHRFLNTPASDKPEEILFVVAPGATFDRVAWDLKKAGAISDVFRFRLLAHSQDALGRVRAGEYMVNTGWTPTQVLRQITEGRSLLYRLSLREGLTWWETARAVEEQGFARYEDFKAVIHDPAFLREHDIPFANAEGFLYPETYMMKKPRAPLDREQAREVASIMVRMFWKKTEALWSRLPRKNESQASSPALVNASGAMSSPPPRNATAGNAPPAVKASAPLAGKATAAAPLANATAANATAATAAKTTPPSANATRSPGIMAAPEAPPARARKPAEIDPAALHHLVILASLVEKETGVPSERGLVAGVYANRLRLGMLLQCDPTIIYGIGESFSGAIRRSQLDDPKNRYNTYQHPGLPPGPICSSGLEALRAAAAPPKHDYLYFVATGLDGGHTFSKTLNEHNKAVQVYRQRMRGQQ